mmetsp:Transcript_8609/g.12679  ORF Transcript_8609/g.12679 Transcript_8609/m.12679 type:complete len:268 (+) Transcript_8609:44-847(+)
MPDPSTPSPSPTTLPICAVGSTNPSKLAACKKSFESYSVATAEFQSVSIPSGVRDQPIGLEETLLGAENRAKGALLHATTASPSSSSSSAPCMGVGLESGIIILNNGMHLDVCICVIVGQQKQQQQQQQQRCVGMSSGWILPPAVSDVFEQKGYNEAFASATNIPPDEKGQGVLHHLSSGKTSRVEQTMESVNMALLQWTNPSLYYYASSSSSLHHHEKKKKVGDYDTDLVGRDKKWNVSSWSSGFALLCVGFSVGVSFGLVMKRRS